jgi:uncharacterized protein (DUF1330 family)
MVHYFLAQVKINNPDEYQKYLDKIDDVFSRYKGEYLSVDESPIILEGDWKYDKTVIIKFKSKQDFEDWYFSDDYQEILRYRLNSSKCDTVLLEGFE